MLCHPGLAFKQGLKKDLKAIMKIGSSPIPREISNIHGTFFYLIKSSLIDKIHANNNGLPNRFPQPVQFTHVSYKHLKLFKGKMNVFLLGAK